jgi:hypothetical protein
MATANGDQAADQDRGYLFHPRVLYSFVPLCRGPLANFSHRGNDYGTSPKNLKTYGSVLVRFFCRKMHFVFLF